METNEHLSSVVVAIDPGVNFGMTVIDGGIFVYHGKLIRSDPNLEYAYTAQEFIKSLSLPSYVLFVLEGAAYNKIFGQVGLGAVRAGFYTGARYNLPQESIRIVAPMSARKAVFGDGKIQAGDVWPTLNHNAADSLALALDGIGAEHEIPDTGI